MRPDDTLNRLLDAALPHVPFDGWSQAALDAALTDTGTGPALGRAVFPRGAVDLALAYHRRGDDAMAERIAAAPDMATLRFRDRIAAAVRFRLDAVEDKELVRRGLTLFALPQHAADGSRALWQTADRIWTALGDTSDDINWYTKRATLSAVYSTTVLYWLGDTSDGHQATREFLDRRIDNVMQFEKIKAKARESRAFSTVFALPLALAAKVRAPSARSDFPGRWPGGR